jgi:transcription initiation factor IIF auxiliary subunit
VFVDEPDEKLNQIRMVIYSLHPTFPNPTQIRDNPQDHFALETAGWGEFNILVTVKFKDGHEEILEYPLNLSKSWPTEPASA